jgi:hypothetical protein
MNIKKYEPRPNSIIHVRDFKNIKSLLEKLYYLSKNDVEYNKYLEYKTLGFSDQFKSIVDISVVHSYCRLCIYMGDHFNNFYNLNLDTNAIDSEGKMNNEKYFFVRERNTFYYKKIKLENFENYDDFLKKIASVFVDYEPVWTRYRRGFVHGNINIFKIYFSGITQNEALFQYTQNIINNFEKISFIKHLSKLEIILI